MTQHEALYDVEEEGPPPASPLPPDIGIPETGKPGTGQPATGWWRLLYWISFKSTKDKPR